MSLLESIDGLITDTVTVTRRAAGTFVNGIKVDGVATTFTADVVMQPAFGLNRVVGGADLGARVDNQSTTDVRDFFTRTRMFTRTPTTEPDVISWDDGTGVANWTIARVEKWTIDDESHFRCVCTKQTDGAS